jgi:site-specific DNA-methyltransferase (adenine-specific)
VKLYYAEPGVEIYHGDCREVLPELRRQTDLVLTDPPYEAEAHTQQRRIKRAGKVVEEPLTFAPMTPRLREEVASEIRKIAKRWVLTFCQVEAAPIWRKEYEFYGLRYMRTCIWVKPDGQPQLTGDRPGMGYETLLAMHSQDNAHWNGGGRVGVFIHNKNHMGGQPAYHQSMKPLPLIKELISLFSDEGELVIDPFMGSGTTLRAAKDLGRKCIGIELEEKYCETAVKRLCQEVLL